MTYNQRMISQRNLPIDLTKILAGMTLLVTWLGGSACAQESELTKSAFKILTAKCGKCHSSENRKADLDLSSVDAILKGGESGDIVAANYQDSLLWESFRQLSNACSRFPACSLPM